MQAGRLRHRVTIQAETETQNAYGEAILTWAAVETVWARVEPLSGRELLEAQQVVSTAAVRVTVRYQSDVTVQHRLLFGTRIYDINAVTDIDERNRMIFLLCTESKE